MNQTYYTILTKRGAALLANATALGVPLKITQMAVGDGNGIIPKPNATQTKLVHEVRRAAINTLFVDKGNPNQIIAEQVIPETDGGWFIHEIGLFDDKGNLIAVGNCPATYKPKLAEGSGRTQVIRMIIIVDNTQSIELKIDPTVVLATRQYVDDLITSKMTAHEKSTNHPNATTKSKGFVQLNSAIDSNLENQAATPLAVKKTYDLANGAVKKSGDTMTGQLILSKNGLKIKYENKNIMELVTSKDNYSHVFYDAEKQKRQSKLVYNSTKNSWSFQSIDDVVINGKSVLKTGDYGIGSLTGAPTSNPNDRLPSGWYATQTSDFPDLSRNDSATLAVYGSSNKNFYVEQLFVVASKTPKIFNRCATINGKQQWYETITTSNINNYIPIGIPLPWPKTTPPSGWFECNGSAFDKSKFTKLAAVYPSGKLPDLRGEFIRGWDNFRGVDPRRGMLSSQAQQISAHRHVEGWGENSSHFTNSQREHFAPFGKTGIAGVWGGINSCDFDNALLYTNNGTNGSITTSRGTTSWHDLNPAGLVGNETRPRNIAFMYIVKAE